MNDHDLQPDDKVSVTEHITHPNPATESVDKVITPESLRKKEAETEKLQREVREAERALNK